MHDEPKPFLSHLEDLRRMIIKSGIAIIVGMLASFVFVKTILKLFNLPLIWAGLDPAHFLRVLGVADAFTLSLQAAFFSGFVFALPFVLYFLGNFLLPALTAQERKMLLPAFIVGSLLFALGVAFCYFLLLPQTLRFFHNYSASMGYTTEWTAKNYIAFCVQMLLGLGLSFELPIVILILAKLGFVDAAFLKKYRRHAIVVIVIAAAMITPTSDLFTLSAMAVPMLILYEICIVICRWMERKNKLNIS
ncbi:MAG: twin-arginine translocase subunit TatC [Verrucomicrobiae bacterium]|nr:twin-arginine translocase subunit TatC [Verrucomicrobiae bacterium]